MHQKNILDYEKILNHIKKENIYPVYLFYGSENYLKENIIKKIQEKLLSPQNKELNYKVFYADKALLSEIINEIETLPFISKNRLVIIKEAENISKEDEKRLTEYFKKHNFKNYFSTLIMIYKEKTPDKALIDTVSKIGLIVNFNAMDKSKLPNWINSKFKQYGKKITPEASFYLQSIIGSDISRLFFEIEKIDLYTKDKKLIEKEDIMITISGSASVNIFSVLDSIGEKQTSNALDGLVKLEKSDLHYLSIFAMIYRQIRLILQAKLLLNNGLNFSQIKNELRLPSFIIDKIIKQSKKYTFKELCQSYELLNIADFELKDSKKNPQIILEELVVKIINQGNSV